MGYYFGFEGAAVEADGREGGRTCLTIRHCIPASPLRTSNESKERKGGVIAGVITRVTCQGTYGVGHCLPHVRTTPSL